MQHVYEAADWKVEVDTDADSAGPRDPDDGSRKRLPEVELRSEPDPRLWVWEVEAVSPGLEVAAIVDDELRGAGA